jgi:transcriptional regulator with XRE-family HTH domain
LPLPGLKHWRLRKRLSQKELARRVSLASHHLYKIESGRRGCNPETAQLLADVLQVDLEDLRRRREDALDGKAPPKPSRRRIPYRNVHQAYLRIILNGAVGSAYADFTATAAIRAPAASPRYPPRRCGVFTALAAAVDGPRTSLGLYL